MTFYTGLRDNTAGPLITKFGQAAVYRTQPSAAYNNTTGATIAGAAVDTAIQMLDLPMPEREFTEEVAASASGAILVGAKELAAASVVPAVDNLVIFGSKSYTILAINTIGPAGVAVVYKMAVQHA